MFGRPYGRRPIREQTQDGEDLVAFVVRVFRGEVEGVSCATGSTPRPGSPTAASGSPPRAVELAGKDGEPLLSLALIQAVVADAERAGTG
jgi:hypothetical protein